MINDAFNRTQITLYNIRNVHKHEVNISVMTGSWSLSQVTVLLWGIQLQWVPEASWLLEIQWRLQLNWLSRALALPWAVVFWFSKIGGHFEPQRLVSGDNFILRPDPVLILRMTLESQSYLGISAFVNRKTIICQLTNRIIRLSSYERVLH